MRDQAKAANAQTDPEPEVGSETWDEFNDPETIAAQEEEAYQDGLRPQMSEGMMMVEGACEDGVPEDCGFSPGD